MLNEPCSIWPHQCTSKARELRLPWKQKSSCFVLSSGKKMFIYIYIYLSLVLLISDELGEQTILLNFYAYRCCLIGYKEIILLYISINKSSTLLLLNRREPSRLNWWVGTRERTRDQTDTSHPVILTAPLMSFTCLCSCFYKNVAKLLQFRSPQYTRSSRGHAFRED